MTLRLALIVACALLACEEQRSAPLPTSVDPSIATNLESTAAVIRGSSFRDYVRLSLDDRDRPEIARTWSVLIGDSTPVEGIRESDEVIAFTIPAGLAIGVYDVTVIAPDGQEATIVDGLRIVDVPVELMLSIESSGDGSGVPIGDESLRIGETLDVFAVLRNSGEFVSAADVTWSVDTIGTIDPGPSTSARFEAVMPGEAFVMASDTAGRTARAGPIKVVGDTQLRIDDAPGGAGSEVGDRSLAVGGTLELHAVEVDMAGGFVADTEVTWTLSGGIGTLEMGPATSTTLTVTDAGIGRVVANGTLGIDETGDLTVDPPPVIPVTLVSDDPLEDGSRRASVFGHGGQIVVGPSDDGTGTQIMNADGSDSMRSVFSFFRDPMDNSSSNSSPDPYPSIGVTGCIDDTPACGPDNENGRGLFGGETLRGIEWMIVGGARDSDLDYIYMVPDSSFEFRFVDLSEALGGSTHALTAMHAFEDDLYLGFSDTGGSRPFFTRLRVQPGVPGLDADDTEAVNLEGADLPNIRSIGGGFAMLDSIWDFAGRVYTANASAWVRAARRSPEPANADGEWLDITPSDPLYSAAASVFVTAERDLESADRAVPYMTTYKGRLYVARNTTAGPQLWTCDPGATAPAMHCDSGDFSLVAPNVAEPGVTNFDNPNNTAITLLAATSSNLYVGFDNAADGVVVFRTDVALPASQSDFEGEAECSAREHPAACPGLGGNGFGVSTNDVIFDAQAATFPEGESVFLTVGDGVVPVRVYRISP